LVEIRRGAEDLFCGELPQVGLQGPGSGQVLRLSVNRLTAYCTSSGQYFDDLIVVNTSCSREFWGASFFGSWRDGR
jgi:hypothetical protein